MNNLPRLSVLPARASEREQVNERKRDGAKDREKRREGVKVAWDRVYFQSRENSDRTARTPPSFRTAALDERGGEIGQKLSAASPADTRIRLGRYEFVG